MQPGVCRIKHVVDGESGNVLRRRNLLFNTRHAHAHCLYWLAIRKRAEKGGWLRHSSALSLSYRTTLLWVCSTFNTLALSRRGDPSAVLDLIEDITLIAAIRCTQWTHRVPDETGRQTGMRVQIFFFVLLSTQHMARRSALCTPGGP